MLSCRSSDPELREANPIERAFPRLLPPLFRVCISSGLDGKGGGELKSKGWPRDGPRSVPVAWTSSRRFFAAKLSRQRRLRASRAASDVQAGENGLQKRFGTWLIMPFDGAKSIRFLPFGHCRKILNRRLAMCCSRASGVWRWTAMDATPLY